MDRMALNPGAGGRGFQGAKLQRKEETMKKIIVITICTLALTVSAASAKQKKRHAATQPAATEVLRPPTSGNPYDGGGPSGANQATNNPKASNEIGCGM